MRLIKELEGLISNQLSVIKTCLSMTKLEAKLAGLSVVPLLINVCFLLVCVMSTWVTAMVILGYILMQTLGSIPLALSGVFIFNMLTLALLFLYLRFNLKKMSFEKTRAYLSRYKELKNNELKKTCDDGDSGSRPNSDHSSIAAQ